MVQLASQTSSILNGKTTIGYSEGPQLDSSLQIGHHYRLFHYTTQPTRPLLQAPLDCIMQTRDYMSKRSSDILNISKSSLGRKLSVFAECPLHAADHRPLDPPEHPRRRRLALLGLLKHRHLH